MKPLALSLVLFALLGAERAASAAGAEDKRVCLNAYENGQRLRLRGALQKSMEALRTCARDSCPSVLRRDCATWLAEVGRAVPTAVFVVRSPNGDDVTDAAIFANDVRVAERASGVPIVFDPGTVRLHVERPPFAPLERTVV